MPSVRNYAAYLMITFCLLGAWAQGSHTPATDDRELYRGALNLISYLSSESSASTPSKAAEINHAVEKELGLSEADYIVLVDHAALLHSASHNTSEEMRVQQLDQQILAISQSLSTEGWASFRLFVNGKYRSHVSMVATSASSGK